MPQLLAFAHLPRSVIPGPCPQGQFGSLRGDNAHIYAHVYRDNPFSLEHMSGFRLCDMGEIPIKVANSCPQLFEFFGVLLG